MPGINKRKRGDPHLISFATREGVVDFYIKHPEIYKRVIRKIAVDPKISHFEILSGVLIDDLQSQGLIGRLAGQYFTWRYLGGTRSSGLWLNFVLPGLKARNVTEELNDLYEEYWLPKHGPGLAKWIYHVQCVGTFFAVWASPVRKAICWALRIHIIGG